MGRDTIVRFGFAYALDGGHCEQLLWLLCSAGRGSFAQCMEGYLKSEQLLMCVSFHCGRAVGHDSEAAGTEREDPGLSYIYALHYCPFLPFPIPDLSRNTSSAL